MIRQDDQVELDDVITELDPPYKSLEELRVGRLLDRYGLPFFYKQPTIIYDQGKNVLWRPAFTLPNYDSLVIDYTVLPEGQDQQSETQRIKQVYQQNQIRTILLNQQDLSRPNWQKRLCQQLQQFSHEHPDYVWHQER